MKSQHSPSRKGFTLIELLAVVAIIAILAGISVAGLGYYNRKATEKSASVQMNVLTEAIEAFRADNGEYPPNSIDPSASDRAKDKPGARYPRPRTGSDSVPKDTSSHPLIFFLGGQQTSENSEVSATVYLDSLVVNQGISSKFMIVKGPAKSWQVVDAFGNPMGYRRASSRWSESGREGINPSFDLWSAGMDGLDDKGRESDDITNW